MKLGVFEVKIHRIRDSKKGVMWNANFLYRSPLGSVEQLYEAKNKTVAGALGLIAMYAISEKLEVSK